MTQNTREIIGVRHSGDIVRDATITYINELHPDLQSIMLELSPGYEMTQGDDNFFLPIAEYYKERGVRVIPGDTRRWDVLGLTLEEVIEMRKKNPIKFHLLETIGVYKGLLNSMVMEHRDKGIEEVFDAEEPEVTLVGINHAIYLKKQNPEMQYTRIRPLKFLPSRKEKVQPDLSIAVDEFDPRRKNRYKMNLIAAGLSAGAIGLVWSSETVLQYPVAILATICLKANLKGSFNYLRALVR